MAAATHVEEYADQVVKEVEPKGNPVLTAVIIEVIMSLIENCIDDEAKLVEVANDPTPLQRIVLRRQIRKSMKDNGMKPRPKKVRRLYERMIEKADQTDDSEIREAFGECQTAMGIRD